MESMLFQYPIYKNLLKNAYQSNNEYELIKLLIAYPHMIKNVKYFKIPMFCHDDKIEKIIQSLRLTNLKSLICNNYSNICYYKGEPLINLTELDCSNTNILNFDYCPNLRKLTCYNCIKIKKISDLNNLEILNCNNCRISLINNLPNLKELNYSSDTNNKASLKGLDNLLKLNISRTMINNLNDFTKLIDLNCDYNTALNIDKLINLEKLSCIYSTITIDLNLHPKLTYLNTLFSGITLINLDNSNLTYLDCSHTDIKCINGLNKLEKLLCHNTSIHSITSCVNLTYLDIKKCHSLHTLSTLDNLIYLNCYECNELSDIKSLTNLRTLKCGYTKIKTLKTLKNLEYIDAIGSCKILYSINPKNHPNLKAVYYYELRNEKIKNKLSHYLIENSQYNCENI